MSTFIVTVRDHKYVIDSESRPLLHFKLGHKYEFSPFIKEHPFKIVNSSGEQRGSWSGSTYVIVPRMVEDLRYICTKHRGMGNQIKVSPNYGNVIKI